MYIIKKIIDDETLTGLNWVSNNFIHLKRDASISSTNSADNANYNKNIRSTKVIPIPPYSIMGFSKSLELYINGGVFPLKYFSLQHDFLIYGNGDFFKKHRDTAENHDPRFPLRKWSAITLIDKTEDLVGGEIILYKNDKVPIRVNLDVGETCFFLSKTLHEVTPVTNGGRKALVSWLGEVPNGFDLSKIPKPHEWDNLKMTP